VLRGVKEVAYRKPTRLRLFDIDSSYIVLRCRACIGADVNHSLTAKPNPYSVMSVSPVRLGSQCPLFCSNRPWTVSEQSAALA
jgi:hypothetical protein